MSEPAAVDPEEAFIASVSSCHMLWFLSIAARRGFSVESYLDHAQGQLAENSDGRLVITEITLRPAIRYRGNAPSPPQTQEMHTTAHQECFIANSIKTNVRIEPA